MTPLSIVFRVDAQDDADAIRQLTEVVAVANRILTALVVPDPPKLAYPFVPDYGVGVDYGVDDRDVLGRPGSGPVADVPPLDAEPLTQHVHTTPDGRRVERPWAPGQNGMGQ